jgi:hypothetical protein
VKNQRRLPVGDLLQEREHARNVRRSRVDIVRLDGDFLPEHERVEELAVETREPPPKPPQYAYEAGSDYVCDAGSPEEPMILSA